MISNEQMNWLAGRLLLKIFDSMQRHRYTIMNIYIFSGSYKKAL